MTCDTCNQPATVIFMQIAGGQMKRLHLCAQCAQEQGVTDSTSFLLAEAILQPGEELAIADSTKGDESGAICPSCGFTEEDLRKTQRLGCSQCYQVFRADLLTMLRNIHEASRHGGKLPQGLAATQRLRTELSGLREQLGQAVAQESYEQAAALRDLIHDLERRLQEVVN